MTNNQSRQQPLDNLIINPKLPAKCSVIWLHGLGADGYDFAGIVPQLQLSEELAVRFVFPHAPERPIAYANNLPMRAWFNFGQDPFNNPQLQDEVGIRASQAIVGQLIDQELAAGIASRRVVLVGFSQGGAMALQCGLRYHQPLGGILSLSGFLLLAETLPLEKNIANQNTPILLAHGTQDPIVPVAAAQNSAQVLTDLGFNAKLSLYNMAHTVSPAEIRDIAAWLKEVLENAYQE